jgi:RNA polymerase sigma factor (sigma-70 family)
MTRQTARDDDAIKALAVRYGPAITSYFRRRVTDPSDVEDLTQEVFLSLARRAELHTIDNIEGYIFRIAGNLIRNRGRLKGRRPDIIPDGSATSDLLIEEISPERILLGAEAWRDFLQALHELPERARNIFILNRFEQMSGREIALRLGVSMSLVEKEMIKAVAYLRGRLG